VALTSYDFERPSTDLKVEALKERKYTMSDYEVFDFDGDYIQKSDGKQLADDHMDELQTPFQALHGSSNAQGIEVGRLSRSPSTRARTRTSST
jgi:type VI secretion system secreted protein VgrG